MKKINAYGVTQTFWFKSAEERDKFVADQYNVSEIIDNNKVDEAQVYNSYQEYLESLEY